MRRFGLLLLACCCMARAAPPAFPLKASADGRYLVDAAQKPFFLQADTAWASSKKLTGVEVAEYLDDCARRGFSAVWVHAVSKEAGPVENRAGIAPFAPLDDILRPVEAYWKNLDSLIEAAERRGLVVGVSALWIRWGGADKEGWRYQLTEANARAYGQFLGRRYRARKNVLWILGGDANPVERTRALSLLASAIKEAAPHHLIAVHNSPENASAAFFTAADWLDVNLAYTYRETYSHVLGEYSRVGRVRPIVLGESGYEEENNDGRGGPPQRVRRQAWHAVLSGALGGHAYGHKLLWKMDPAWRDALSAPGRTQMGHLKSFFASREWWRLVPDGDSSFLLGAYASVGKDSHPSVAVADDGSFAVVYLPVAQAVRVDPSKLKGAAKARWFNPSTGEYADAGTGASFAPPGEGDWALVFESR